MSTQLIKATKYKLTPDVVEVGTRGSYAVDKIEFEFDETWDGLTKKIVFYPQRGKSIELAYIGGEITIPTEIMKYEGMSRAVISGASTLNSIVGRKIISLPLNLNVEYTLDDTGSNETHITQDTFSEFLTQAEEYLNSVAPEAKIVDVGDHSEFVVSDKDGTTSVVIKEGKDGADGKDGVSPTATVIQTEDGAKLIVTDGVGTTIANVYNGTNGEKGDDGISPSATVVQTDTGADIIVCDGDGCTTAHLTNGESGVYVGGGTPPSTSNIWINPTGNVTSYDIPDDVALDGAKVRLKSDGEFIGDGVTIAVIPSGGTTGQVLKKKSNGDGDTEWANGSGGVLAIKMNGTTYNPDTLGTANLGTVVTSLSSYRTASAQDTIDATKVSKSSVGQSNGVASLDSSGKVPASQIPSSFNNVFEASAVSGFPSVGESGKIYVATGANKTYRWNGSTYVEVSPSIALGTSSDTAYRGDRGNIAYNHSQKADGSNPHMTTFANITSKPTTLAGYGITDAESAGTASTLVSAHENSEDAHAGIFAGYQKLVTKEVVTLPSSGWSGKTQTVQVAGVLTDSAIIVSPSPSDMSKFIDNKVYCSGQGNGTLTFVCDTIPNENLYINVMIM